MKLDENGKHFTGVVKKYYEDTGKLMMEIPYRDGLMHGAIKIYHRNGTLNQEIPYVEGQIHGVGKYYFDNGNPNPYLEISFYKGQRHGVWKRYDGNGKVYEEEYYAFGVKGKEPYMIAKLAGLI